MVKRQRSPRAGISQAVLRSLDIVSAALLLTGQITIGGVFLASGGFALSLSGPFTGEGVEGDSARSALVLDALDVITALLLIIGEIDVIGTYVTAARFTIVVGGPPFGLSKIEGYNPRTRQFFRDYTDRVMVRHAPDILRKS